MSYTKISIQTRLTLLVLCTVLLFGLIAGYASYTNALHEADEIFDAQLAQSAQSLLVVSTRAADEQTEIMPPHVHKYQQTLAFQVWNTEQRRLILCSKNVSTMTYAQIPVEGYSSAVWQGEHWRYYRQRDPSRGMDVLVGQNDHARNEMAQELAFHNLTPFLLGLPLLGLCAMMAIRLGLKPLRKLTESLQKLSPLQLQPVLMPEAPQEIAPVVDALNILLDRITKAMDNERRFTADASHELRTPLAALHAQIQAAQLSVNAGELKECLAKALQGAERMTHLVAQLLTLSRLDEHAAPLHPEIVNLSEIIQECCAELGPQALFKNIELGFIADANPALAGYADLLHILLRNLLDNAIRYTPQGGRVEVSLHCNEALVLEIADSGSGVNDAQLALLGQRFNRINQNSENGVGLGLSIVQRITQIHHAKISFSRASMLGGLRVEVHFRLHQK
jgi:two-component system, OmpR family, sensor histidine kinase QseC